MSAVLVGLLGSTGRYSQRLKQDLAKKAASMYIGTCKQVKSQADVQSHSTRPKLCVHNDHNTTQNIITQTLF